MNHLTRTRESRQRICLSCLSKNIDKRLNGVLAELLWLELVARSDHRNFMARGGVAHQLV